MTATLIDGTSIAAEVRAEVGEVVKEMRSKHGIAPGLAVVLIGDDPASAVYVRMKERAAVEAGMVSETINMPADTSQDEALAVVQRLNNDARYHGILVQLPLPDQIDEDTVIQSIDPDKDVDGLAPLQHGPAHGGRAALHTRHAVGHPADAPAHRQRPVRQARRSLRSQQHRRQADNEPA